MVDLELFEDSRKMTDPRQESYETFHPRTAEVRDTIGPVSISNVAYEIVCNCSQHEGRPKSRGRIVYHRVASHKDQERVQADQAMDSWILETGGVTKGPSRQEESQTAQIVHYLVVQSVAELKSRCWNYCSQEEVFFD